MIDQVHQLDKVLDNRFRLGMVLLMMELEEVSYTRLKTDLKLSDGNLASHLKLLERHDYISYRKKFIGRKPNTIYFLTLKGQVASKAHIAVLRHLLRR
jgi:DNA-binding HxlR family transcriptional regulator